MGKVFTKKWFEATLIRMIRTGAEAALAVIGSTTMFGWLLSDPQRCSAG